MSILFGGYDFIPGGVCAPSAFLAGGVHCGLKSDGKSPDLAAIFCNVPCKAAAVYTQNKVKGAPIAVTKAHLKNKTAQAVIVNSGNANTCNADGEQKAEMMCRFAADMLGIDQSDVIVASTGIIGEPLPIELIEKAMPALKQNMSEEGNLSAAQAIMTTDTKKKEYAVSFEVGESCVKIGGMAKGSGMIHPNMATMLCFITTDANINGDLLQIALKDVADKTFNMISVDGDTSTNDMAEIMASGTAGNKLIDNPNSEEYKQFENGLYAVMMNLAREMAADGEGATKLLTCAVTGAKDEQTARILAKSVINSSLFKSAMFGKDPNWGRILCAIGYADAEFNINEVEVTLASDIGRVTVCKGGNGTKFDTAEASALLAADEIVISISVGGGEGQAVAWGCDLTYDYVKINADYHS